MRGSELVPWLLGVSWLPPVTDRLGQAKCRPVV